MASEGPEVTTGRGGSGGSPHRALLAQLLLLASASFACRPDAPLTRSEYSRALMGTEFRIAVYAPDDSVGREAADAAFARIEALERVLSDFDPDSELSRLSVRAGASDWVRVSADLWDVLVLSQEWAARTGGAFDITVGALTQAWRWGERRDQLPPAERLATARASVGHEHLELDSTRRSVRLRLRGMRLDVGGIGKGYAADEALRVLRDHGIERALVDAGGDLVLGDSPPGTTGWSVELPEVGAGGARTARVGAFSDVAIATSGDSGRSVEVDGVWYSHVLDPRSGEPVTTSRVVTVIAPTGAAADALASAWSVLGPAAPATFAEESVSSGATVRILQADGPGGPWALWEVDGRDGR